MQLLGLALPAILLVLLHLSPTLAQLNITIAESNSTVAQSNSTIAQSNITQPSACFVLSDQTSLPSSLTSCVPAVVSIADEMAFVEQFELSLNSLGLVTDAQSSVNPATYSLSAQSDSSILQQASTSSSSIMSIVQLPDAAVAQSTSSTKDQTSSDNVLPLSMPQLPSRSTAQATSSANHQISSRSSSSPSIAVSAQDLPAPTLVGVPVPTAVETVLLEVIISSTAGLGDAILADMGILPSEASATPAEVANAAIESGGKGVEIVQIFPTTTLIASTVSSVLAATTGAVEPISVGTGIVSPGTSATLGEPANSAIPSGGNVGGGDKGGGGGNGSSVITGSGSTPGTGNPTESVSGHTNVPIVSTGGAEGVTRCESWWLEFGILVWGVGMVYWV